jgi:hypothetical protein
MSSKIKGYSNDKLIEEYYYLVDSYNEYIEKGNTEFANNMMSQIPLYEAELSERGLIGNKEPEPPKLKAKLILAPTSRAQLSRQEVQNFVPVQRIPRRKKEVSLKISNYFLPKSRFISYQTNIRTICRYLKQYNGLKPEVKQGKAKKYKEALKALKEDCLKIVESSVMDSYTPKVLSEPYKVWKGKNEKEAVSMEFSIQNFDVFLKEFFK